MDAYDFARKYLHPFKIKGNEIIPKYCPFCNGGEHHDKETFALNTDKLTYNCLRGSCGESGHFKQLCDKYGEKYSSENYNTNFVKKTYIKPSVKIESRTEVVEEYLASRCISKKTMDAFRIGQDDKNNIIFPFYENGELVFVKYRPARKVKKEESKSWRDADTKPILFGMDMCDSSFPLVITEGEIDCMACYESGATNVVSVPSGTNDMTWMDTCWGWLKQFESIIICADNDPAGQRMALAIIKKLSDEHIMRLVQFPDGIKDADEMLYKHGKEKLAEIVLSAKEVPVKGLIRLADVIPLDARNIARTLSNIKQLDASMGGFLDSEVTVWTGQRGHGKSTVVGQILIEAVEQRKKVCAYSGELNTEWFKYWVECQMAGPNNVRTFKDTVDGKEKYYVPKEVADKMRRWYEDYFYMYDNEMVTTGDESKSILKIFEHAIKRYDCKIFLVDNLMTAKSGVSKEEDYYRSQSNFVGELVNFAKVYGVHVHLVAHPRKTNKDITSIDCDDVAGIADITNRVHNVLLWSRIPDKEKKEVDGYPDGALRILKNRSYGATENILFKYDEASRRVYQRFETPYKKYGWEYLK